MRVLLCGLNYWPERIGVGKYSGELGDWLVARGHQLRVITARPYYPEWRSQPGHGWGWRVELAPGQIRHWIHRVPIFVPRRPDTLTRLLHLLSFGLAVIPTLIRLLRWRPRVVILVVPTLFAAPAVLVYARLTGVPCVLHVQDWELDALVGLDLLGTGLATRLARAWERWLLGRFDRVSTLSSAMLERAMAKGVDRRRLWLLPNWVDCNRIHPGVDASRLRAELGLMPNQRVVLYAGNIGRKQGLELLVDAAQALVQPAGLVFLVVGEGVERDKLVDRSTALGLTNLRFAPLQPAERLPELLALAEVHLVLQRRDLADAVMPSKLSAILAAGGFAIVAAEKESELGRIAAQHPGIYRLIEPEQLQALIAGLRAQLQGAPRSANPIARAYAERHLEQRAVLGEFEQRLRDLVDRRDRPQHP